MCVLKLSFIGERKDESIAIMIANFSHVARWMRVDLARSD
jgi:hypothetical protein